MNRNKFYCWIMAFLSILIGMQTPADAQITWRVSVKFIVDVNGIRSTTGNFTTNAAVQIRVDTANALLARSGRGYQA